MTSFGDSHLNQIQLFSTANKLKILIVQYCQRWINREKILLTLRDLDTNGSKIINENDIINYILMHGDINANKLLQKQRQRNLCIVLNNYHHMVFATNMEKK